MKKIFLIMLSVFSLVFSVGPEAYAKTVLMMNHQFQASDAGSKIDQWFANEIKRATGGEVEIRIFWSNGLGEPIENLALLRNGDIDMAAMSAGYFPAELPLFSAPNSIPMSMENVCQASSLMKSFMDTIPAFALEAKQNGIRPLFFHVLNPYLLFTKEPVTQFSQLQGKRIRTWGKDMPLLIKAAGAKPVNLFLPDLYDAMKQDVIDGCPFSVDLVDSFHLYELAKHITEVVLWEGPTWGVWISEITWQKLTLKNQKLFLEIAEKARQQDIPSRLKAEKQSREFLKSQGVIFHQFPPKELAKWKAVNPDFFTDFIKKMQKRGKGDSARNAVILWKSIQQNTACADTEGIVHGANRNGR
jgi:TRAP-type transport system periplasmic protein